ncbi:D-alanyl-D-alanine carboxypeptidase family protein [Planococcus sp. YIM B11945]|uniref:D-alanyl-D-alanine carboxypeptidase family protein n=1 Tax=Planococcus sp. YIM B11945 TaxID=3435410 RepID=UPI003D7E55B3
MKKLIIVVISLVISNTIFVSQVYSKLNTATPSLSSEAAIVIEANSGEILYEKNARISMYPASVTKIATAIYAIETAELNEVVTVSTKARLTDGTRVYLEEGEQVPLKKLLQGLLVNSGNDAGVAIAEHLSGSVELFAADINAYLKDTVGIQNTNFENPHGLFDKNHVTTAEDLAILTKYAMKNEEFMGIFGTKELPWDGETWDTILYNHHKLMREMPYEGVTGGKNGFVEQAGTTLVTTAERENLSLIVVTLKGNSESAAYSDTIKLLDYGFGSFATSSIDEGTRFAAGGLEYSTSRELFYTRPIGEQPSMQVQQGGKLEITDSEGTLLFSNQLQLVDDSKGKQAVAAEHTSSMIEKVFSNSHYLLIVAVGLFAFFCFRIRKI